MSLAKHKLMAHELKKVLAQMKVVHELFLKEYTKHECLSLAAAIAAWEDFIHDMHDEHADDFPGWTNPYTCNT